MISGKLKALVIEPSILYQQLMKMQLGDLGYEVIFSKTGQEGLSLLSEAGFEVVIFAMFLPDMTGETFCSHLRSQKQNAHLPAFMITSTEDKDILEKATAAGVTEIFHKDDFDKLADYLRTFTEKVQGSKTVSGLILYVEDSLVVAAKTMHVLEGLGLQVHHFTQAEDALEALDANHYELVVTDVMLREGMSGIAFTRILRGMNNEYGAIPILALTGLDDVARRIELFRAGVNDYVSKPVIDEELIARVRNLITNKKLVDQVRSQQEQLLEMAMTDSLTKVNNRHFLMEVAPKKINEAYRHKIPLSMILIDLDHFKEVNDTHGHTVGDLVLSSVGDLLNETFREEDITVRFGGEEFLIILSYCDEVKAMEKAEYLRSMMEGLRPGGVEVTGSFGVATLPLDFRCDFSGLFSAADQAVYKAKASGRNRVIMRQVLQ